MLRKNRIIVVTGGIHKGKIGKLVAKPNDMLQMNGKEFLCQPKTYGIIINATTYGVTYKDLPILIISEKRIRYAYPYEKLLRRRKIDISDYEKPCLEEPLRIGQILIHNNKNMDVHSVISNIFVVLTVNSTSMTIKNIVTKQIMFSNIEPKEAYRSLNTYEIRKLNKYGKTIITDRKRRQEEAILSRQGCVICT